MENIPIFKVGGHTATNGEQLDVDADFINAVVTSYDPKQHEAPAVIGHPKDNQPAYGWVESLSFDEEEGVLYANFKQLDEEFVKMLEGGRFKKRSASFYPPEHPENPIQGQPYLRHVGFLGAQPPAVKGLADFSEDKSCMTYEFSEITSLLRSNPFTRGYTNFAERETNLKEREQALARREKEVNKKLHFDYAEMLVQEGKILPIERQSVIELLCDFSSNSVYSFSENGGNVSARSGSEALKSLLSRLHPIINFSEITAQDPNQEQLPQYGLSDGNQQTDEKIQAFANKHNMDYAEAVLKYQGIL